jgi:hypothetical protein
MPVKRRRVEGTSFLGVSIIAQAMPVKRSVEGTSVLGVSITAQAMSELKECYRHFCFGGEHFCTSNFRAKKVLKARQFWG